MTVSGRGHTPVVALFGPEIARIALAIPRIEELSGRRPTIIGGLAMLCRVGRVYRATTDLDTVSRRDAGAASLLQILRDAPGSQPRDAFGVEIVTAAGLVRLT